MLGLRLSLSLVKEMRPFIKSPRQVWTMISTSQHSRTHYFILSLLVALGLITMKAQAQNANAMTYSVQLIVTSKPINPEGPLFLQMPTVHEENLDTAYAYVTAPQSDLQQALKQQKEIRSKGFKNAVVVAYKKGKRVPFNASLAEMMLAPPASSANSVTSEIQSEEEQGSPIFIFIR